MSTACKSGVALFTAATLALLLCLSPVKAQDESTSAEDGRRRRRLPLRQIQRHRSRSAPTCHQPMVLCPARQSSRPRVRATPAHRPFRLHLALRQLVWPTRATMPVASGVPTMPRHPIALPPRIARQARTAAASVATCADYPTWYDAQLALESSVDPALTASLDPDGNTIACEEVMYPGS